MHHCYCAVLGVQEETLKTATSTASLRLCRLKLWSHFDGFGFVLTAVRTRQGQYIADVEDGSPAKAGGLKSGDRLVEVIHQQPISVLDCSSDLVK